MHRVVWERLLALSGTSYKWFSQHGVHPSSGLIIHFQKKTSFAQDSQISYWLQPVCPRSPLLPYGFTSVTWQNTSHQRKKIFDCTKLLLGHIKNTFKDIKNASMAITHYMEFSDILFYWSGDSLIHRDSLICGVMSLVRFLWWDTQTWVFPPNQKNNITTGLGSKFWFRRAPFHWIWRP